MARWLGASVLLAALLAFPFVFTLPFPRHVMIIIFLYATLAQAWNILAGYCGQISLGHAVFFGIGAYTSTVLVRHAGLSPWLGMLAGACLAVAASQAIGFRSSGCGVTTSPSPPSPSARSSRPSSSTGTGWAEPAGSSCR
ncbi:MAG: hypothetical protein HY613_07405 [Candidatus Rokubacteria bacterium]|nr:hypothetical protein [Candidatus Rokubacteria bacterium]